MKKVKYLLILVAVACMASCGTVSKTSSFSVASRLEMTMQDLVYLGDCEISCDYDTYLGVIRHITKVNGQTYDPQNKEYMSLPTNSVLKFPVKAMSLAAAKILKQYPNAEYLQVVRESHTSDKLFLGSSNHRSAKVRVYKFK